MTSRHPFPPSALPWFLIVACLMHLWMWNVHLSKLDPNRFLSELAKKKKAYDDAIVLEKLPEPDKPIVRSSRAKNQAKDDKAARFNGELKNRVEQETKSPLTGKFAEGHLRGGLADGDDIPASPEAPGQPETSPDGETAAGQAGGKGQRGLGMSDLLAFGRTPNSLPKDIADGNETVLNTDPVRYAGFINRIAEVIYDPWVAFAREAVDRMYLAGRKLDENTYITKLTVTMNNKGGIDAIQTLHSSGVDELDEAPKKAFWEVEPFQNPPPQMFQKDDSVRFTYEFHFQWRTSSFSIHPFRI